jgi:hypothetical protein
MKMLAGVGPSIYEDWRNTPVASLISEASPLKTKKGKKTKASRLQEGSPVVSLNRIRIRRMANLLEDERFGGPLLPKCDWEMVEELLQEAQRNPAAQHAVDSYMAGQAATHKTRALDAAGDPHASRQGHLDAIEIHKQGAESARAAKNDRLAHSHDLHVAHHERHAAVHAARKGKHVPQHHVADPYPQQKPADATKHWVAKHHGPAATKPVQHEPDMPGYEGVPKHIQKQAARAQHVTSVAHKVGRGVGDNVHTMKAKAHGHGQASSEHLQTSLHLFHSGDHKRALQHFNAAVKEKGHHHKVMADVDARERQASRRAAPAGPRGGLHSR